MLSICLFFEKSELKYAYKLHAYKKECTSGINFFSKVSSHKRSLISASAYAACEIKSLLQEQI